MRLQAHRVVTGVPGSNVLDEAAHLRRTLGFLEAARARDERPVLVFFHWPHDHARFGKETTRLCDRVLEDETVARWTRLFRTVRVEMEASDAALAARIGADTGPSLAVLDRAMKVVARLRNVRSSTKLHKWLATVHAGFPAAAARLRTDIAMQRQWVEAARRLLANEQDEHARHFLVRVTGSPIRVDPIYDQAIELRKRLDTRRQRKERAKR